MHYKKRKLHKLHSIPIGLCNKENHKRLYLVSYSIPLSCMVVLLLGLGMIISPDHFMNEKSYAVDGVARANVNPSLGLSVTNSDKDKVIETVQGGSTAYSDHLVTITGEELTNYTLSMSSSSSNLTKPSGTSGVEITGAGGVTGDSMTVNHWGYAVTEESASDSSYGGLTYNTVPTTATKIAEGNAGSDNTLNVKKKIVIAARFGEDAAPGTYRQAINLSAVANPTIVTFKITYNSNGGGTAPAAVTQNSMENSVNFTLAGQGSMSKTGYKFVGWSTDQNATSGSAAGSSYIVNRTQPQVTLYAVWRLSGEWSNGANAGVSNMQDITSNFCNSSIPAGSTITLTDNRGTNIPYKIIKMGDGTCWMAENLRLMNTTINSTNSDMTSGSFTIPVSDISGFNDSDKASPKAYYADDVTYGAYYNWYTATAGTAPSGGDTSGSICPKKWKLPAYSGIGSFQSINNSHSGSWTAVNGKNGRNFGYNSDNAFFPAAGYVGNGSLGYATSSGLYWSRRSRDSCSIYYMNFSSGSVYPQSISTCAVGYSVRCVAEP